MIKRSRRTCCSFQIATDDSGYSHPGLPFWLKRLRSGRLTLLPKSGRSGAPAIVTRVPASVTAQKSWSPTLPKTGEGWGSRRLWCFQKLEIMGQPALRSERLTHFSQKRGEVGHPAIRPSRTMVSKYRPICVRHQMGPTDRRRLRCIPQR